MTAGNREEPLERRARSGARQNELAPRLAVVMAEVGAASRLIESRFVEMGDALESTVGTLRRQIETCGALAQELNGPELTQARHDLEQAASDVLRLCDHEDTQPKTVAQLIELTRSVCARISEADDALKPAAVLSVNAKVEAARLGSIGADFIDFSEEITPSLNASRSVLSEVGGDTLALGLQLQAAHRQRLALDQRKQAARSRIPASIVESAAAIDDQRRQALELAEATAEQSRTISREVSKFVMALQIGDATRQRAEHVLSALEQVTHAAGTEDCNWSSLSICCALQAAQLDGAAEDLQRDAEKALFALRVLAGNADGVVRIGDDLFGSGRGDRRFLDVLQLGVGDARALFTQLQAARDEAGLVIDQTAAAAARLVAKVDKIRSLEIEVQHLALNAFLRCGRIGPEGRALSIIAQELRLCADKTAGATSGVASDLEQILGLTEQLTQADEASTEDETDRIGSGMTSAAQRLSVACERMSQSFECFARDSEEAARLIGRTVSLLAAQEEVGRVLRSSAVTLAAVAEEIGGEWGGDETQTTTLLAECLSRYTMSEEREIHSAFEREQGRVAPGAAAAVGWR